MKKFSTSLFALLLGFSALAEIPEGFYTNAIGKQDEDAFYTLSGQRIGKRPMKAGIYIRNGKKVLIR